MTELEARDKLIKKLEEENNSLKLQIQALQTILLQVVKKLLP